MYTHSRARIFFSLIVLPTIVMLFLVFTTAKPTQAAIRTSHALTITNATQTATTTGWANVRTGPNASSAIVSTYAPGTTLTVYASVNGQVVWNNDAIWYRVSAPGSQEQYVYAELVSLSSVAGSSSASASSSQGKVIEISLSRSWLCAYENGKQVFDAAVITSRPGLPTPTGTFHVFAKLSPTTFYAPWPVSSPNYYPPTHINYALEFLQGGFFLHDTWWHTVYGPGTNGWHYDPAYGWQYGSHGCVGMPISAARWLYNWAPIGTTVHIS